MAKAKGRIRGSHNGCYAVRRSREEAEQLLLDNLRLVPWTIRRMGLTPDEDTVQDGNIGLWLACLAFDDTAGKRFSGYAISAIANMLKRKWQIEQRNVSPAVSLDETGTGDEDGGAPGAVGSVVEDKRQTQSLLDLETRVYMEQTFSSDDRYILSRRMEDATLPEIGGEVGRTGEWVRLRLKSLRETARQDF